VAIVKTIPGPPGLPLVGNVLNLLGDALEVRTRQMMRYPNINKISYGPLRVVRVNSAEYVRRVLIDQYEDFDKTEKLSGLAKPVLGDGLLAASHSIQRRNRRLVQPAFNHSRVSTYAADMVALTEVRQERWADSATIDLAEEMQELTMQIISKAMFSSDVTKDARELGDAIVTSMAFVTDYFLFPFVARLPLPVTLRYKEAGRTLNRVIQRLIAERKASGEDRGDLLSMLIQSRDEQGGMDDEQIRDEIMNIFLAGHETTANALAWAGYLLATHPGYYDQLLAEVDAVLQGRTPTVADLPQLPFTQRVFKETLRLYPPAYMTLRLTTRDTELDGYPIAEGTLLVVDFYTMHRRADYFPNPNQFDPDRFSPEHEKLIPKGAYLPFGTGPRVCIGNGFAMMEGQLLLATLAQHVRLRLAGEQQVKPEPLVSLRPKNGIKMIVERRS